MFAVCLLFVSLILGLVLIIIKKENVNTIEVEGKQVERRTVNPTYKNVSISFQVFLYSGIVLLLLNLLFN
jgi:uncharacterized protein YabE (DUF348 family)